ncbi:MAG TPA: hypothetical protein VI197_24250 [Polyangiaceae bacterium]
MDPLLHPQDSEIEAQLLAAGRDVSLSPAAQARLLGVLGASAGVTAAGEAAASTGFVGKLLASKGILAAASVVSIGAIGAGVYFAQRARVTEAVSDRPPLSRAAEPAHVATPASDTPAIESAGSADDGVVATEPTPASVDKPAAQPRPTARKPAADAHASLRDELALVEAVSRATKAGNGALALSQSLEYKRRFPRGKLALEAQVLHIEALALAGNRAEASRLAQSFLKRYPDSPVAARIRRFAH